MYCVRVRAFACQKQGIETGNVIVFNELAFGVFTFDCAKCGWRCEQDFDVMFFDDAPESACIGGADWFAFEHDGRVAVDQGRIADIAVANDPADI